MRIDTKFERVQWPVGHGGFHTGRLKGGDVDFRYFFDCGAISKVGKELIREKLAAVEFDFGVISHFDNDHYSELASAKKVKVLFIPYMTPADMVLQAVFDEATNGVTLTQAFEGFNVLRRLQENGTSIVMVDGRVGELSDTPEGRPDGTPENLPGGLSWRIPGVSKAVKGRQEMRHEAAVEVLIGTTEVLYFKFFNHRMKEASQAFAEQLEVAVKERRLKKEDETPYTNVADFLDAVLTGDAQVVRINGTVMQDIYKQTLTDDKLKASPITGSNLSSVTMYSRSACHWRNGNIHMSSSSILAPSPHRATSHYEDGWMLTGDLELTPKTWPAFNDHYFYELSECTVFNVPHHASEISLCEEATTFLASKFFVMSVNAEDGKHPADALKERLARHGVNSPQSVTTAWESTVAFESLLVIGR